MSVNEKNLKIKEAIDFVKNNKDFFLAPFVSEYKIYKNGSKSHLQSKFIDWFENLDGAIKESVQNINGSLNYALGAKFREVYAKALVGSDTDNSCVKNDNYDKFEALLNDNENLVNALISLKNNPGIDQWYVDHNNKIAEAEEHSITKEPTQVQPTQVQPTQVQPTQVQPTQVQPTQVQPTQVQPTQAQPTQAQSMNNDNNVELQSVYLTIRIRDDDEYPFNQPDTDWQNHDRDLYISVSELNDENNLNNTLLARIHERNSPLLVTKEKGRISTQGHEVTQQQLDIHRATYVVEIKIPKDIADIIPKATNTVYNNAFELQNNSSIKVDQIQNISLDSKLREYHVIALANKPESSDKLSLEEHEIAVYKDNGNWFCVAPDKGTFQLKEEDLISLVNKSPVYEGSTNEEIIRHVNFHLNEQVKRANRYNGKSDLCRGKGGAILGAVADLILNTAASKGVVNADLEIKYHLPNRIDFGFQPAPSFQDTQEQSDQAQSQNLLEGQISIGYNYGEDNKTRSHMFTVKSTNLDDKYHNLEGDALKRAILIDFKSEIESCNTTAELETKIGKLKESPEYQILKTAQRPVTKYLGEVLGVETSAIKAFNGMHTQAKNLLASDKIEEDKKEFTSNFKPK